MSEPVWVPIGAAGAAPQTFFAIDFRNPQVGGNAGNVYPAVNALTGGAAWEEWTWAFRQDVQGILYGIVRIPETAVFTNAEIDLELSAASAGVTKMDVYSVGIADGETLAIAAWGAFATNNVTLAAGRIRKKQAYPVSAGALAAGDLVVVAVLHDGTAAADTLAVQTELIGGYLVLS